MKTRAIMPVLLLLISVGCGTTPPPKKKAPEYAAHRPWAMLGAKIFSTHEGQKINSITPGGAAAEGGLMSGDIILSIDGRRTGTTRDFIRYVRTRLPGSSTTIRYQRDIQMARNITVKLQTYPQDRQLLTMGKLAIRALDYRRAADLLKKLVGRYPTSPLKSVAKQLISTLPEK